jgi:hypothetical protein
LNLAPTLGRVKSSISHGDFAFPQKNNLLKLKYTRTFTSTFEILSN